MLHLPARSFNVSEWPTLGSKTSKGNQTKWNSENLLVWIKAPFVDMKPWRDYLVEIISAEVGLQLKYNVLNQGPAKYMYKRKWWDGVWSYDFARPNCKFIPFDTLLAEEGIDPDIEWKPIKAEMSDMELITYVTNLLEKKTSLDMKRYIREMVTMDFLIANEDRHEGNFGVLWDFEAEKFDYAPLFDFGLGLFEHDEIYSDMPFEEALESIRGRAFSRHLYTDVELLNIDLSGEKVDISGLEFPSEMGKRYFLWAAAKIGLGVVE